ncbi:MAG: TIGR03936 family radical SAM-associated protein [Candidatus Omnitrophica bacterium]|nr:TIGR03936 family radical SAM-associated protein [Candidatus Omnitrophota bacterium]MCM8793216.1 TIGR03936 family radical SAM-associated protein [Candidatus Omnitrophota bacterium]
MQKLIVKYSKTGLMIYISQLDLLRLFQRALRRAEVPFVLTKGFNPHPKISFKRALKLGVESFDEEVIFYLEPPMGPDLFRKKLQKQLPEGIEILSIKSEFI